MPEEKSLEEKCKEAVIKIYDHVRDINYKLSHFLENYRKDYYDALDGIGYQESLKEYQR
jgi:hypothetical protein